MLTETGRRRTVDISQLFASNFVESTVAQSIQYVGDSDFFQKENSAFVQRKEYGKVS